MIRLRVVDNMGKNLRVAALAVLLFAMQGGFFAAYGTGVSIGFDHHAVGSGQTAVQIWGESATPLTGVVPSVNTSPETSNKIVLAADLNSTQRPYVEVTNIPPATPSYQSAGSTSSSQPSCPTCYDTSEHTAEILVPGNFNTMSEKVPLLSSAESYSVTVCVSYKDKTADDCKENYTPSQTGEKLAANIIRRRATSAGTRPFRVVLPSLSSDQQIQVLRQIEKRLIDVMEVAMLKNQDREKQDVFAEEIRIARQEAEGGVNWSQDLKSDRLTYNYRIGQALDMVNSIIISSSQTK